MKRILFNTATAALIAGPAIAADMPVKYTAPPPAPFFTWTGFYIGAGIGARGATIDNNVTAFTIAGVPAGAFTPGACASVPGGCVFGDYVRVSIPKAAEVCGSG